MEDFDNPGRQRTIQTFTVSIQEAKRTPRVSEVVLISVPDIEMTPLLADLSYIDSFQRLKCITLKICLLARKWIQPVESLGMPPALLNRIELTVELRQENDLGS